MAPQDEKSKMNSFPTFLPDNCPSGAQPMDGTIFRGCETDPFTMEDFTPHTLSNKPEKRDRCDPSNCNHWGLSVWIREQDALHAQDLYRWAARWFIFSGKVSAMDGVIKETPGNLPGHHTFWTYEGVSISQNFSLAHPPKSASK